MTDYTWVSIAASTTATGKWNISIAPNTLADTSPATVGIKTVYFVV